MEKIKRFNLPEHTSQLYKDEAISSISLTREVADKINEIIDCLNVFSTLDLEWKQGVEGRVAKGIVYMKDNLINSLETLLDILKASGYIDRRIENHCDYLKQRLDTLITNSTDGTEITGAEIIDARVDGRGNVKGTLGENIRDLFILIYDHLNDRYLDSIEFYNAFSNIDYTGTDAYNRIGNAEFFNLEKDVEVTAPAGYKVSVTVWNDGAKVADTGWLDKVVIPKNYNARLCVKKDDDSKIDILKIYNVKFKSETFEITNFNFSDEFEYTSSGFYSPIRLSAQDIRVDKPITIICPEGYSVAVTVYRTDKGDEPEYQRGGTWVKKATLQTGLSHIVTFKKDDGSMIFRSDLHNIIFTDVITTNDNVKSVCHRGYNIEAPENTLPAYKLAKKNGFKYVECDVSFTRDNVGVLLHDNTIDRTSNGTGNISNMTYEEVSALDFGSWFNEKYTGEKIPTFEEFIALCRDLGLHPYIEIKYGATQTQVESLVDIVKRYGMKGKVTYISFEPSLLTYVFNKDENARLGFVVSDLTEEKLNSVLHLNANKNLFIDVSVGNVTDTVVELALKNELPLEVWSVNNYKNILNTNKYVSGFTTDYVLTECLFDEVNYE